MNAPAILIVAVLASAAAATGVTFALQNAPPPASGGVTSGELQQLAAELRAETQALRELIASRPTAPAASLPERTATPGVSDAQIDAAITRWLAARGKDGPTEAALALDGIAASNAAASFDPKAAFRELRGTNAWENNAAWRKAHESGRIDEVLAEFEANAEQFPNDPQAHLDLANAYLGVMQFDQTRWQLSIKADESFDKVLSLDENHWEARFSKAVSYTFWPDFLGKKKEAISHFERLVEQQKSLPPQPHYAETYLFLGNILEQRGEIDRAKAIWGEGARRHPEHAELRGKTGG